jgi:hypothetical protein
MELEMEGEVQLTACPAPPVTGERRELTRSSGARQPWRSSHLGALYSTCDSTGRCAACLSLTVWRCLLPEIVGPDRRERRSRGSLRR